MMAELDALQGLSEAMSRFPEADRPATLLAGMDLTHPDHHNPGDDHIRRTEAYVKFCEILKEMFPYLSSHLPVKPMTTPL